MVFTGSFLCLVGVLVTAVGYLDTWRIVDWFVPSWKTAGFFLCAGVGHFLFGRGEKRRWNGQMVLSRLGDYRRRHRVFDSPLLEFTRTERRQSRWKSASGMAIGTLIVGLGAYTITSGTMPAPPGVEPPWSWALHGWLLLVGACMIGLGNFVFRQAVRDSTQVVPSFQPLTPGSYVLYLRNFSDDAKMGKPYHRPGPAALIRAWFLLGRSEEERIATSFHWAGPVVAVGIPGEKAPNDAIPCMYLPDEWKEPVRVLMRDARLVVLVLGRGAGTLWELGEAMRSLPPRRLVLLNLMDRAPYEKFRIEAAKELRGQAEELRRETGLLWSAPTLPHHVPADKPISSRVSGIVYFTDDWQARFVPASRLWPDRDELFKPMLRPTLFEDRLLGALELALWVPMARLTDHERRHGAAHG